MPCYLSENTSEPFTTTLGSKLCTFQNSNEIWPNSPKLLLFFSFLFLFFANSTKRHPSRLPSLPLSYSLVLCTWTQKKGGNRGNLAKITPLPSLSLQPPLTPNHHQAATHESAKTPPASHSPPLPHPFSLSRPEATQRALVPTRAQEANQPLPPRHPNPLATVVDAQWPAATYAVRWPSPSPRSIPSRARSGRRERHSHFEACTHFFPVQCMSPSTASKPQQRATLA
jgi:hypothetical protein